MVGGCTEVCWSLVELSCVRGCGWVAGSSLPIELLLRCFDLVRFVGSSSVLIDLSCTMFSLPCVIELCLVAFICG